MKDIELKDVEMRDVGKGLQLALEFRFIMADCYQP